jgi:type II secretory pathway component PulK
MIRAGNEKQGSILIVTLWSVFLLTTLAVILGFEVREKLALVKRLDERDKIRFAAEAAIKKAIVELKKEKEENYSGLNASWSTNDAAFREISVGDVQVDLVYDFASGSRAETVEKRSGLVDEESKININKAGVEVSERFFHLTGLEENQARDLAYSIIDWRDSDSELSVPSGSAESPYYKNLPYPYEAKDGDFEVPQELLLVKGMTENIFERIKNYITIYGGGKVNINTASRVVLLSLGFSTGLADKLITLRSGKDGVAGTADDNVFPTPENMVSLLTETYRLSDPELTELNAILAKNLLTTNSRNFMVKCLAKPQNSRNTTQVTAVINSKGIILYWMES